MTKKDAIKFMLKNRNDEKMYEVAKNIYLFIQGRKHKIDLIHVPGFTDSRNHHVCKMKEGAIIESIYSYTDGKLLCSFEI